MSSTLNPPDASRLDSDSQPAVLLLIFNRPVLTRQVFDAIREARPAMLFVHADGPRSERDELELCNETRAVTESVDWPCIVYRKYQETNLGCGPAVAHALGWFFEKAEDGIVLEDDCLPGPAFFRFCTLMLDKHRDDPRIMHISGMGFDPTVMQPSSANSSLLPLPFIWGWATWRRAWLQYRFELPPMDQFGPSLRALAKSAQCRRYWKRKFRATAEGIIRTWDYQWVWSLIKHEGRAVTPHRSLVRNLGFGPDSTHTIEEAVGYAPYDSNYDFNGVASNEPDATMSFETLYETIFRPMDHYRWDDWLTRSRYFAYVYLGLRRRFGRRS